MSTYPTYGEQNPEVFDEYDAERYAEVDKEHEGYWRWKNAQVARQTGKVLQQKFYKKLGKRAKQLGLNEQEAAQAFQADPGLLDNLVDSAAKSYAKNLAKATGKRRGKDGRFVASGGRGSNLIDPELIHKPSLKAAREKINSGQRAKLSESELDSVLGAVLPSLFS